MIKRGKKAQFQMSFGMMFSIILIVAFIVVAIIAINSFLGVRCSTEQGQFIKDLDSEITRIWKGAGEIVTKDYQVLGCDFEQVCFYDVTSSITGNVEYAEDFRIFTGDEGDHNLYFYPRKESKIPSTRIEHINMDNFARNPLCFRKVNEKISIKFSKSSRESLVNIE